jgi:hypothetical protein
MDTPTPSRNKLSRNWTSARCNWWQAVPVRCGAPGYVNPLLKPELAVSYVPVVTARSFASSCYMSVR